MRAVEFARRYFECKLRKNDWAELRRKIEALRVPDPKNSSGAIDLDAALGVCLQKYRILVGTTQDYVRDIFMACDVRSGAERSG